jgi:Xaa-Pro aminopeptidase
MLVYTLDVDITWHSYHSNYRYFNEANLSLDFDHWSLMEQGKPKVPSLTAWLAQEAAVHWKETGSPFRIAIDPYVHAASFAKDLQDAFETENADAVIGELVTTLQCNLIDPIWSKARPAIPTSPFCVHPLEYGVQSVEDKLQCIRTQLEQRKATLEVFSTLDALPSYLFNLCTMGNVETCPVGLAYATVAGSGSSNAVL